MEYRRSARSGSGTRCCVRLRPVAIQRRGGAFITTIFASFTSDGNIYRTTLRNRVSAYARGGRAAGVNKRRPAASAHGPRGVVRSSARAFAIHRGEGASGHQIPVVRELASRLRLRTVPLGQDPAASSPRNPAMFDPAQVIRGSSGV